MIRVGCLGQILLTVTVLTLNLFLLSVAVFFRALPVLIPILIQALLVFMRLSTRCYHWLFTRAVSGVKYWLGIDLSGRIWRVSSTMFLSLNLGLVLLWFFSWPLNFLTLALIVGHGVGVNLLWNEASPDGITTGTKIPWEG